MKRCERESGIVIDLPSCLLCLYSLIAMTAANAYRQAEIRNMGLTGVLKVNFPALNPMNTAKAASIPQKVRADAYCPITHAIMWLSSGSCGAFSGALDNVLWVDEIRLEY